MNAFLSSSHEHSSSHEKSDEMSAVSSKAEESLTQSDKKAVASSFSVAAATYESVAGMQKNIATRLLSMQTLSQDKVSALFDVGCGTGYFTQTLSQHFPSSCVTGVDLAEGMIAYAKKHNGQNENGQYENADRMRWCCADAESLPYAGEVVDLVFSSFAMQWCSSLDVALAECYRVLRPSGQLVFSIPGQGTLAELECSWAAADDETHVNTFASQQAVQQKLQNAGFSQAEIVTQTIVAKYKTVRELTVELKTLGAQTVTGGRVKSLTGKTALKKMIHRYEQFRETDGMLPATYEVIYVRAIK
ncbi:MAG: malonyl-ACP O-methyltransferase BioC [Pseudomonadales bacterium]|nr:malonyl-ACP O-methyltransferase BioC [Pseudomonadales bacterium]